MRQSLTVYRHFLLISTLSNLLSLCAFLFLLDVLFRRVVLLLFLRDVMDLEIKRLACRLRKHLAPDIIGKKHSATELSTYNRQEKRSDWIINKIWPSKVCALLQTILYRKLVIRKVSIAGLIVKSGVHSIVIIQTLIFTGLLVHEPFQKYFLPQEFHNHTDASKLVTWKTCISGHSTLAHASIGIARGCLERAMGEKC